MDARVRNVPKDPTEQPVTKSATSILSIFAAHLTTADAAFVLQALKSGLSALPPGIRSIFVEECAYPPSFPPTMPALVKAVGSATKESHGVVGIQIMQSDTGKCLDALRELFKIHAARCIERGNALNDPQLFRIELEREAQGAFSGPDHYQSFAHHLHTGLAELLRTGVLSRLEFEPFSFSAFVEMARSSGATIWRNRALAAGDFEQTMSFHAGSVWHRAKAYQHREEMCGTYLTAKANPTCAVFSCLGPDHSDGLDASVSRHIPGGLGFSKIEQPSEQLVGDFEMKDEKKVRCTIIQNLRGCTYQYAEGDRSLIARSLTCKALRTIQAKLGLTRETSAPIEIALRVRSPEEFAPQLERTLGNGAHTFENLGEDMLRWLDVPGLKI